MEYPHLIRPYLGEKYFIVAAKNILIQEFLRIQCMQILQKHSVSIASQPDFNFILIYIDIITHPGAKADINTKELARAASKRGTLLEINASHGFMTVEYVKIAMKEGVNFVIDSDAHKPEDVGNFEKGIRVAVEAGLPAERIVNAVK
jgi:putative hydrolase